MTLAIATLQDPDSPATASVATGLGFNCFQFQVERNGRRIDILWSAPDFAAGTARPSGSGIPLLFPFPGRIPQGVLQWDGKEYRLLAADGRGNAIHGFVLNRPWRIVNQSAGSVTGEFHAAKDDPSLLELWPADFRIRVSYTLRQATLSSRIEIDNPDARPLPCGLGTHPYFRVPLGGAHADGCIVTLPVTDQWELVELLPTGNRVALPDASRLRAGMAFGEMRFDNVFAGLQFEGDWCRTEILDPHSQLRVVQRFDGLFRECVVYTPPHREAICIEPYTCVPGCFALNARGVDAGLQVVPPGGTIRANVEIAAV